MRKDLPRYAAALIGEPDDDVLGSFAYENLDRGWIAGAVSSPFDDGLYGIPQQLADDVLQMAQDVGEGGVEVTSEIDIRYGTVGSVRFSSECLCCLAAPLHDFLGIAAEKDLPDEVRVRFYVDLGVWEMPRRIEGFSQGEVLLCDDTAGDALQEAWCQCSGVPREASRGVCTDRRRVFMNLSISAGRIRS